MKAVQRRGPLGRWGMGSLGLVFLLVAMIGVGPVQAQEQPEEWDQRDECRAATETPCWKTDVDKWRSSKVPSTSSTAPEPWNPFGDVDWVRETIASMEVDLDGRSGFPVVAVDMKQVTFPDAEAWINPATNRTMLPIRRLAEALGAHPEWNEITRTATVVRDGITIELSVDHDLARVNGRSVELDAPLLYVQGRILAPLRFISETFGLTVDWIGEAVPDYAPHWQGRYQIWLWDPNGYWGRYTMKDRVEVGWWQLRTKEVEDLLGFCRGEEVKWTWNSHWTPREILLPKCGEFQAHFGG